MAAIYVGRTTKERSNWPKGVPVFIILEKATSAYRDSESHMPCKVTLSKKDKDGVMDSAASVSIRLRHKPSPGRLHITAPPLPAPVYSAPLPKSR